MSLILESSAFTNNEFIPSHYTCEGANISPPLSWQSSVSGVQSYVIILNDPDATIGNWVHWILFNITPSISQLAEGAEVPPSAICGTNTWGNTGYSGPCPPSGIHSYVFNLYALDTILPLDSTATSTDLEQAMSNHILEQTTLVARYRRNAV